MVAAVEMLVAELAVVVAELVAAELVAVAELAEELVLLCH